MLSASLNKTFLSRLASLIGINRPTGECLKTYLRPHIHESFGHAVLASGMASPRKEGNVLFNDALNTFLSTVNWRRTCGK